MCGKFTQMATWEEVVAFSQPLVAIPDEAPVTVSTPMRWGFSKPDNPSFKPDHMHVRSETIDTRPTFFESFAERRGIVVVSSFNEGEQLPSGKTQQWVIRARDRKPIPIAVVREEWVGDSGSEPTFVMATTSPNPLIARIADRMPAILPQADWPLWLGETDAPLKDVKALLRMFDDAGAWEMTQQAPSKASKSAKAKPQMDLF